jgi:predicted nuclease of predicted toxin-antitoxin system
MKLLFDENLPPALVGSLQERFPGSTHVHLCGLGALDDSDIWEYARTRGFAIVTKDSDSEQRSVLQGFPPKVIWLRTGNCTTEHLVRIMAAHAQTIESFAANGDDAVLELV